jgi:hypothetical protein
MGKTRRTYKNNTRTRCDNRPSELPRIIRFMQILRSAWLSGTHIFSGYL